MANLAIEILKQFKKLLSPKYDGKCQSCFCIWSFWRWFCTSVADGFFSQCSKSVRGVLKISVNNYFWSSFSPRFLTYQCAFMLRLAWMDRVDFTVLCATIFCLTLIDIASRSALMWWKQVRLSILVNLAFSWLFEQFKSCPIWNVT